jgi:tRNA A37 threonylcarbamoyladenosine synthetase subunit TsaC/SUA5/YrdC
MKDLVFLTQTDTTVGFLSQNREKLYKIKSREQNKPFIKVCDSLHTLTTLTRVPNRYKTMVRNSKKTTFVYKKDAIRVVKDKEHLKFLKKLKWCYSTSANKSGDQFEKDFAIKNADIVIYDKRELSETTASKIYKINNRRIKRLR